jgi:hypothetical protein
VAFGVAGLAFARSRETREAGESEGLTQGAIRQFRNAINWQSGVAFGVSGKNLGLGLD